MSFETLILLFMATFFTGDKEANENFITICKSSPSTVKIDYMDSRHGIAKIESSIDKDTLVLKVYVSTKKKQESKEVKVKDDIKFVQIGNKRFKVTEMANCKPVHSGKDALEQLKKMSN